MADTLKLSGTFISQVISSQASVPDLESSKMRMRIAAAEDGTTSFSIGSLTKPKAIAVFGAAGIEVGRVTGPGGDFMPANPWAVFANNTVDGIAQTELFFKNASGIEQTVDVVLFE